MKVNSWLITVVASLLYETEYSKACDTEGDIRLANGRNKFEGRVEVCQTGQWKTVCDRQWDDREARVVCRQLGFSGNLNPRRETDANVFGQGSGGIIAVNWYCFGTETKLLDCINVSRSCDHSRDAGVYCFGNNLDDCNEGNIRLRNGDGSSGRVEVCLDGHWGTVCDDGWDSNDATTVCRQLGYTDIKRVIPTRRAYFGEGSGPIHLSRAECKNNDTRLVDCTVDKTGINACDHSEDAGVICMGPSSCGDGDVQLVGGEREREGRVEICYNGVWGTVCDYGWDEVDANVVCRQLRYGQPAIISDAFGVGEGPPLLFNVTCNHTHLNLSQCVHPESIGLHDCVSQNKRAGVICPELAAIISPSISYTLHSIEPSITVTDFSSRSGTSSTDVYSMTTIVHTTQRKPSTESDVFSNVSIREERLRIILSVAGGVLALVIVIAICICFIMVVIARRRKNETKLGGSIDNPNYEEGLDPAPLAREVHYERDYQNPIYSDVGANPATLNPNTDQMYEGLYSETILVGEATYENANDTAPQDYLVPQTIINKQQRDHSRVNHNGTGPGTTSETRDDNYSALGPTDYSTLQPHIPNRPVEQHLPPAAADYSQLHHL